MLPRVVVVAAGVEAAIRIKVMEAKVEAEAGVEIKVMEAKVEAEAGVEMMEAMVAKMVSDVEFKIKIRYL